MRSIFSIDTYIIVDSVSYIAISTSSVYSHLYPISPDTVVSDFGICYYWAFSQIIRRKMVRVSSLSLLGVIIPLSTYAYPNCPLFGPDFPAPTKFSCATSAAVDEEYYVVGGTDDL